MRSDFSFKIIVIIIMLLHVVCTVLSSSIGTVVQYNGGFLRHDTVDPMLLPSGNSFKCHEEVLSLQPMIPPKRFDIFSP